MVKFLLAVLSTAAVFWGCSAPEPAPVPSAAPAASTNAAPSDSAAPWSSPAESVVRYRCEQNIELTVRFADDTAMLDAGAGGSEVLLRDAGGTTPLQAVYSNPRVRAEFGLGVSGREAILRYPLVPLVTRCVLQ